MYSILFSVYNIIITILYVNFSSKSNDKDDSTNQ